MQDPLLIEVQEQMGKEKLERFFKRFGPFLGYCAIAIVVFFGGFEAWKANDAVNREELGDKFFTAVSNKKIKTSEFAGRTGYMQIALMAKAAELVETDKVDRAIKIYKQIWTNKENDPAIKKIAKLKAAILLLNGSGESSAETPAWLNSEDDKIFEAEFNELVALHALKNSNLRKAEKEFQALKDNKQTPPTIRNRADAHLAQIQNK